MQNFKVHYSIRGGPGFIHFTGPGRIKAGFYSLIFNKKKLAGFYGCKGRAVFYTQPVFIIIMTMITIMFRFRLRYDYGFDFGYVIVPKNYVLVPKHYVNFVSFLRGIFRCNPGSLNRLKIRINKKNK